MLFTFITCKEALRRLDDYIDRELTLDEMERVQRHLALCRTCARKFAFEARVLSDVREKLQRIEAPEDLVESLLRSLPPSVG